MLAAAAPARVPVPLPAENPGEALQKRFESAKSALATGNFALAEQDYLLTISLGLRQLGNLAVSEQRFEQATAWLDEAVKLDPDDLTLKVDDAVAWFRRGDAQKASQLLQSVLAADPRNTPAHNALGRLYLSEGDATAAARELQQAVNAESDFETAYFLGVALLQAKKTSEAASLFAKLQANLGDSPALHVLFGRAYTLSHMPEQAVQEFRKAIKLDPKYPRAHALLGYATLEFYGEASYPQARELFQQELQLQPNDYLSLVLLGICDTSLRDYKSAESVLLHATRLRPDHASPYLFLGETYSATGRPEPAIAALRKYVALAHPPQESNRSLSRGYFLLGQDLLHLGGHADEARQALARSQQLREAQFKYDQTHFFLTPEQQKEKEKDQQQADAKNAPQLDSAADARSLSSDRLAGVLDAGAKEAGSASDALAQAGLPAGTQPAAIAKPAQESDSVKRYRAFASQILGSSYNDLGVMRAKNSNFVEASQFFKQAHEWNPSLPGLDRNLGLAAYRAEDYSAAIPALERSLATRPTDSTARQVLALSYFAQDNYARTAEVLRPLLPDPPGDPALLFAWGTSLVRTRDSASAGKIFERLVQQNTANPAVHLLLGQAYAQEKDYPAALREFDSALQLDPKLAEAHYYAGLVYLHQSDFENAIREFRAELALRPDDPVTTYHLAFALLSQGQTEEAVALLRQVVRARPDYELAYFELGRALLQQGDTSGAIASLEKAKSLQPDRDLTYFQLSQAYRRAGRTQDAEQALLIYKKMIEESRQKRRQSLETETP
jgi:tetratricopeptide (TPR) repeat protein